MGEDILTSHAAPQVLVMDDEEEMRAIVCLAFRDSGYSVAEAATLSAARQLISQNRFDLVVCDVHLAEAESGVVLLRELAPRAPDLAVVMMTADAAPQVAIDCLRDGAFDYLLKPFSLEELKAVVQRVFFRQRQMITARDHVQAQLRILGKFSSENPNPVLRVAKQGQILYCNAAGQVLLTELGCGVGQTAPAFLSQFITDVFERGRSSDIEVAAAGQVFSFAVTPVKDADYVYLYGHDITRLKETEHELIVLKDQAQEMALHDVLTGLPNRILLEDRLQQAMVQSERNHKKLAVVFIDLDNFKGINDAFGHRMGDQVLTAVSHRLCEAVRRTDTVGRWGGDELILLLPDVHDPSEARRVCERLKSTVQKNIAQDQITFPVSLSMGIAIYPDDSKLAGELMQHADAALYLAKSRGRDQIILFSESRETLSLREKSNLRALLSRAIAEQSLQVHYQPIVDAGTGTVVGVEALARWYEETLGWVSPGTFIPLAEELGLISALGWQVLKSGLQQLKVWKGQGNGPRLSVNVSIRQILNNEFIPDLSVLMDKCGISPRELMLELTESQALLGSATEFQHLSELSQKGFHLAIDDFGQGYSSLSSLHDLPVEELKIDMKFAHNLHTEKGRRIVQAIVELAKALGLETVAEGVEQESQMIVLKRMGVTRMQGFYFGKPRPAHEVTLG